MYTKYTASTTMKKKETHRDTILPAWADYKDTALNFKKMMRKPGNLNLGGRKKKNNKKEDWSMYNSTTYLMI